MDKHATQMLWLTQLHPRKVRHADSLVDSNTSIKLVHILAYETASLYLDYNPIYSYVF